MAVQQSWTNWKHLPSEYNIVKLKADRWCGWQFICQGDSYLNLLTISGLTVQLCLLSTRLNIFPLHLREPRLIPSIEVSIKPWCDLLYYSLCFTPLTRNCGSARMCVLLSVWKVRIPCCAICGAEKAGLHQSSALIQVLPHAERGGQISGAETPFVDWSPHGTDTEPTGGETGCERSLLSMEWQNQLFLSKHRQTRREMIMPFLDYSVNIYLKC